MAAIFGRTGILKWGETLPRSMYPSLSNIFARYVHTQPVKPPKKIIISPELRRDLIEEAYKVEKPKQYVIDGINDPGDQFFGIAAKSILEHLKKTIPPKK